ncbi:MAG: alanine dehydrogenase [Planctomycetota bacterium]|nr:MAG: alanine dehydrogenase [Planctomycetota bacterium]
MIIGVPREIKRDEYRVGILPAGVEEFTQAGHRVLIEAGAGLGSGIADHEYLQHGAEMVAGPEEIYGRADMVLKVKEPQLEEIKLIQPGQIVFTYFHLAADRQLTEALLEAKVTAVAYETLRTDDGRLPLLTPMSEVAGRMSIQEGAKYLERPQMGRGILLGGVPGVQPAHITVLGGGVVGANAAKVAAGFGASVSILDIDMDRLRYLDDVMPPNVTTLYSDSYNIRHELGRCDLLIGAVLVPGARTPVLVREDDLRLMKSGAVLIDVAVDQGGCIETSRPTTHSDPTFIIHNVVHYCVANMPGAVGRTSTFALCHSTQPWARRIADLGILEAAKRYRPIARAVNIYEGELTNRAVADSFKIPYNPAFDL